MSPVWDHEKTVKFKAVWQWKILWFFKNWVFKSWKSPSKYSFAVTFFLSLPSFWQGLKNWVILMFRCHKIIQIYDFLCTLFPILGFKIFIFPTKCAVNINEQKFSVRFFAIHLPVGFFFALLILLRIIWFNSDGIRFCFSVW